MSAEVLHSAMRCLPVTPHENTEVLVIPGPTRIQIGHMTQYDMYRLSHGWQCDMIFINEWHI